MCDMDSIYNPDSQNQWQDNQIRHVEFQFKHIHDPQRPNRPYEDRQQDEENRTQISENNENINDDRNHGVDTSIDITFSHQTSGVKHMHSTTCDVRVNGT